MLKMLLIYLNVLSCIFNFIRSHKILAAFLFGYLLGYLTGSRQFTNLKKIFVVPVNLLIYLINLVGILFGIVNLTAGILLILVNLVSYFILPVIIPYIYHKFKNYYDRRVRQEE